MRGRDLERREVLSQLGPDGFGIEAAAVDHQGGCDELAADGALHGKLYSILSKSEDTRALASSFGDRARRIAQTALHDRRFGDPEVDALLLVIHLERGPYMANAYPLLAQADAIAATTESLPRGFFESD